MPARAHLVAPTRADDAAASPLSLFASSLVHASEAPSVLRDAAVAAAVRFCGCRELVDAVAGAGERGSRAKESCCETGRIGPTFGSEDVTRATSRSARLVNALLQHAAAAGGAEAAACCEAARVVEAAVASACDAADAAAIDAQPVKREAPAVPLAFMST